MYKVEILPIYAPEIMVQELNTRLKDGWELVQVLEFKGSLRYIFKKI